MSLTDPWAELYRVFPKTRDVVLVSHPKSGRTWIRFMLNSARVFLRYSHGGAGIRQAKSLEDIEGEPCRFRKNRVIFLTRDPRDTAVSAYFEASKRLKPHERFGGTIGEFIRSPRFGIEKIARFNLLWLRSGSEFEDFITVAYEDLRTRTQHELGRVIEFATGHEPDLVKLNRAVSDGRFENMRKIEQSLSRYSNYHRLGGGRPNDEESLKTRRGRVGGWTDYLTADDAVYAERVLESLQYQERLASLQPPRRAANVRFAPKADIASPAGTQSPNQ